MWTLGCGIRWPHPGHSSMLSCCSDLGSQERVTHLLCGRCLVLVPALARPAPSPGPCCRSVVFVAKVCGHCRRLPRGTDSPRATCQPRGSRWFCTFFKHLFSESIACRLTTQERPPPPCVHMCLLFQLNWEHETHTVLHLACFTRLFILGIFSRHEP